MKHFFMSASMCGLWLAIGNLHGQTTSPPTSNLSEAVVVAEPMPPEVKASAVAAVNRLGSDLVQGRFQTAVERMYPAWKISLASRMGGIQALEMKLAQISAEMTRQGISVVSSAAQGEPISYEVVPGTRKVSRGGNSTEILAYTKWLVIVPTVTRLRMTYAAPGQPARVVIIESSSFQAAISDKSALDWTFMDGATLTPSDLRRLFGTLPTDIALPAVTKREVR